MDITRIDSKFLFGVNIYLIENEGKFFLIDTGLKRGRKQLLVDLEKAECEPGNLELIILTHGHVDHVGNAAYLRDNFGAKIAMHREDTRMIETGDMFVDTKKTPMIRVVGGLMRLIGLSTYERFTPDIRLEDEQDLSEYGLPAKVIHIPGHSNGSICLYTEDNDLFCGDIYGNEGTPEPTTIIQNQAEFDSSIERIKQLELRNIYPGHGKPFTFLEM